MRYATIEDIYTANERFRGELLASISGISADEAAARPAEGGWCVAEIVEHLAAVEEGMGRIAAKLLREAEASTADNGSDEPWVRQELVETFIRSADVKVEAPERVRPSGEISIPDSLAKMDENKAFIDALREQLAARGRSAATFPHPFFGALSAAEWLALKGLHEARHTRQIASVLAELRK